MPFIKLEDRNKPLSELKMPGEMCFKEYRKMIRTWRNYPGWGTADQIATQFWPEPSQRARMLAFFVFFALHVIPYELEKREENGEVI